MATPTLSGFPTWRGGERLTLTLPGAAPPIASVALTSPISASAAPGGDGGFPLYNGSLVAFLPSLPPATEGATIVAADAAGASFSLGTPVFAPLYGTYTFALRSYLPATWDAGPRSMADVPPAGETSPSNFASLTSSLAEGLNLFGGVPLTRLTADAASGATVFNVEHSSSLPTAGRLQVDGVGYRYASSTPGPTSPSLTGLTASLGGATTTGTLAFHASGAQVAYLDAPGSDLTAVGDALFLDTAEGPFLTAIGRNLGVAHSPAVSGDDQYRALVKAIAYGPKTSVYGVQLALDALLGAGTYSLREDPVGAPCTLFITVPYGTLSSAGTLGRSYIQGLAVGTKDADGRVGLEVKPVGVGPVYPVSGGIADESNDLSRLVGTASTATSPSTLTVADTAVPAPLIRPSPTPLPSDVGARVSLGGAQPGRYWVAEVRGDAWAVHEGVFPGTILTTSGTSTTLEVPVGEGADVEAVGPFVYPRDIGRTIACQGKTGTVAAILDAQTRANLAGFATQGVQRSNLAQVSGLGLPSQAGATVGLVPTLPTATGVSYIAPRAYVVDGQKLTRRQPLTSPPDSYLVAASTVLSAEVLASSDAEVSLLPDGSDTDLHPLYIDDPFAVLEAYLGDLTAAGITPVLEYSDN